MSSKDGWPAFPSHGSMGELVCEGMSLRDYFAANAMQGILANPGRLPTSDVEGGPLAYFNVIAKVSYQFADAMLIARN